MQRQNDIVVAYADVKSAALYFPYVVPETSYLVSRAFTTAIQLGQQEGDWQNQVLADLRDVLPPSDNIGLLLPPHMREDKTFMRLLTVVPTWEVIYELLSEIGKPAELPPNADDLMSQIVKGGKEVLGVNLLHTKSLDTASDALWDRHDLRSLPALMPAEMIAEVAKARRAIDQLVSQGKLERRPQTKESLDYRFSLVNANLIDASAASWDQILSIREDTQSQAKLQTLRRFFTTNFEGKSESYIKDYLHQSLEAHDATAKEFGFQTKALVLDALFTSKLLQRGVVGAGLAILLDEPIAALASGFSGVLFEVGNTSVKLMKHKFKFQQAVEQHPLSYIIDAKQRLKSNRTI